MSDGSLEQQCRLGLALRLFILSYLRPTRRHSYMCMCVGEKVHRTSAVNVHDGDAANEAVYLASADRGKPLSCVGKPETLLFP